MPHQLQLFLPRRSLPFSQQRRSESQRPGASKAKTSKDIMTSLYSGCNFLQGIFRTVAVYATQVRYSTYEIDVVENPTPLPLFQLQFSGPAGSVPTAPGRGWPWPFDASSPRTSKDGSSSCTLETVLRGVCFIRG